MAAVAFARLAAAVRPDGPHGVRELHLHAVRRLASGGVIQQAIGAIENALLDITAKALGIPVYRLLGGPVRERIRLYWSHCGTYRLAWPAEMRLPPLRTLEDVVALGREVVARGYTALKTNVFILGDRPYGGGGDDAKRLGLTRPFLHAWRLSFSHPVSGERIDVEEPVPADLDEALATLRS